MTSLTPRDLVVDGLATRVYEGGDPAAQSVLLVHDGAYGTDALLAFGDVGTALAADFHVVMPDLLGWGGSAKVHHFDQSLYAPRLAHLAALLRELGLDGVHAVGNSFGGSLLLRAATASPSALPLRSVTSIAGTGGPWRSQTGMTAMADYQATREDARRISDLVVGGTASEEHVQRRLDNSLVPGHWESLRAWGLRNPEVPAAAAPADDYPASLETCGVPVLLLAGDRDVMVEPEWLDHVTAAAPSVRTTVLSSGHSPNIDQPAEVEKALRAFWDDVS